MVERHAFELQRPLLGPQALPADHLAVRQLLGVPGARFGLLRRLALVGRRQVGDPDGRAERGQRGGDLVDGGGAVVALAVVVVAVDGDEHLGLDLLEPVDDARHAEVRRAGRPDRAERGRGQAGDQGLRDVGQVGGHPVAPAHTEPDQPFPDAGDLLAQLGPGQLLPAAVLGDEHQRGALRTAQRVFRVIDRAAGEPGDVRHLARQHGPVTPVADHVEVVPDRRPELGGMLDRPAPGVLVVAGPAQPPQVAGQLRRRHDLFARFPQQLALSNHVSHPVARSGECHTRLSP